ncbi:MAG: restriction endonuclease [Verrucomicrobia bacterium]|nr:restriction endonuclease [Verrucomicrobiota bacterium]
MPRSSDHPAHLLVLLPWYVAAAVAGLVFAAGPFLGPFGPASRLFGFLFLFLAALSALRAARTRAALASQTTLEELLQIDPKHFEELMGEVFRREGYAVQETLSRGADGGIDLRLRRGADTAVVQCKRWASTRKVGAPVLHQILGVSTAEGFQHAILVTTSGFTAEARSFAGQNGIELVDGQALLRRLAAVRANTPLASLNTTLGEPSAPADAPSTSPACPNCGRPMVERTARRGATRGQRFHGCPRYPHCNGTRSLPPAVRA